ncbi:hypothetical protein [Amycolatopsis panacis]|uniref:Nuclear transport factor 2 family protein n=1 Tax=Amycolatopsis panacis TaxID=2340917 RepID=A0A419I2L1_9PSEU|nr:hypothetical protein [Amycolatopsis panacis]RJQ84183.1 hypothetical protein D5S19_17785 [Amycolatopsis panacis]
MVEFVDQAAVRSVADAIGAAVAAADVEALRAVYVPTARIWTNLELRDQTVEESLASLGPLFAATVSRGYDGVHLTPTPSGYVSQHDFVALLHDGSEVRIPICVVVTLAGERVARIEEYIESGAGAPLWAAIAARKAGPTVA